MKTRNALAIAVLVGSAVVLYGNTQAIAGCGACNAPESHKKAEGVCCPKGTPPEKQCGKCQLKAKEKGCGTCAVKKDCPKCVPGKGCPKAGPALEGNNLSTEALRILLDSGVKVTVLDARGGKWDDGRRIPGAKGLPADSEEKAIRKAAGSKKGLVVTYCSNLKCGASAALAKRLGELGYKNVIEYPLGIQGWADAGLDIEKAK